MTEADSSVAVGHSHWTGESQCSDLQSCHSQCKCIHEYYLHWNVRVTRSKNTMIASLIEWTKIYGWLNVRYTFGSTRDTRVRTTITLAHAPILPTTTRIRNASHSIMWTACCGTRFPIVTCTFDALTVCSHPYNDRHTSTLPLHALPTKTNIHCGVSNSISIVRLWTNDRELITI